MGTAVTGWFIVAVFALIVLYDLTAFCCWGESATISAVLRCWGQRWGLFPYLIAFGMGALFAHLFLD